MHKIVLALLVLDVAVVATELILADREIEQSQ